MIKMSMEQVEETENTYALKFKMEKTKTRKCPLCEAKIEELNFDVTGTCSASMTIEEAEKKLNDLLTPDSTV